MKYWLGPMSKNVVDAVIESKGDFGFIPSRRQVDYNGGYVNDWSTGEFATYVDGRVPIERDHGGAGQGYKDDDGYTSFRYDCQNFDIIHIHANNYKPMKNSDDIFDVLELTLVHKNANKYRKNYRESFPIKNLDFECFPHHKKIFFFLKK